MAIEIKEIIVRTTVNEGIKHRTFDQQNYNKLKAEIISELKKENRKLEKRRKER